MLRGIANLRRPREYSKSQRSAEWIYADRGSLWNRVRMRVRTALTDHINDKQLGPGQVTSRPENERLDGEALDKRTT